MIIISQVKYIRYLDANNLYALVMSQYLLYSGFKCLNQKEIDGFNVNLVRENSSHGYILEIDLENPDGQHELHNDYLLAPEKLKIGRGMLSRYCSNILDQYNMKVGGVNK